MSGAFNPLQSETTEIGEQTLVPGVTPITKGDRLAALAAAPMLPAKVQRPCDLGLFDMAARNQPDLFDKLPRPPEGRTDDARRVPPQPKPAPPSAKTTEPVLT